MARKMKDSGIEWIGEIPEDWEIGKISQLYFERKTKVNDRDFPPLSVTMKGIMPQLSTAAKSDAHDDRKLLCIGDFAINSRSDRRGSCGISQYNGSVSLINIVLTPKVLLNSSFYDWLFHTSMFSDEFYKWGHGIVDDLWTTNWQDMKKIQILVPELKEQQRIADFLDQKCAQIDEILQKTRDTIAEYKKLKQSIITQAVTKGVRCERPMKDSGIEWIGEIPEEWEVSKLKYCVQFPQEKYISQFGELIYLGLENIQSWNGKYIETDSKYDRLQSIIFYAGDILWGKLRPYLAKVYQAKESGCCSGEFCVIRLSNENNVRFFWNMLISYAFVTMVNSSTYGTKMPRANVDFIKNMFVPIPNILEQQEIAQYLDEKCAEIDKLIEKKEQLVGELENYKKSLIYEYVTGKKEVLS